MVRREFRELDCGGSIPLTSTMSSIPDYRLTYKMKGIWASTSPHCMFCTRPDCNSLEKGRDLCSLEAERQKSGADLLAAGMVPAFQYRFMEENPVQNLLDLRFTVTTLPLAGALRTSSVSTTWIAERQKKLALMVWASPFNPVFGYKLKYGLRKRIKLLNQCSAEHMATVIAEMEMSGGLEWLKNMPLQSLRG